jgi:hypothetical protein
MKPKSIWIVLAAIAFLSLGVNAPAQTWTAIMSGENSEAFSFINNSTSRTTVTSIQSPFAYPNTITGSTDTQTYPTGNGSLTPPWWFYYTVSSGVYTTHDLTSANPGRPPSYGQTSAQKSAVYGIRPKAAFSGSVSGSSGTMLEAIYFSERADWAGQREFGFFRQMSPGASLDKMYFYWSTNSNCSISDNQGYPYCRTSQATNSTEDPATAPLASEYFLPTEVTGLTPGTTYYFNGYLFWAGWDSTYKFRVEVWDSTYSTEITAFNVDTSSGGVNYGLTTAGMNGYVTLGTQRADPNNALSSSGIQLSVTSVEIVQ